jgi:hypothetical protein
MESIVAALASGVMAGGTLILTIALMFLATRGTRGKFVSSSSLVLKSFSIQPSPDAGEPFIRITGRNQGIISWLMTLIGIEPRVDLTVNGKELILHQGSLAGMLTVTVPLGHVKTSICGHQRSLSAMFFTIYFGLTALGLSVTALPLLASMLVAASEGARETAAAGLANSLFGLLVSLALFGVAAAIYYFSKRLSFGVVAEKTVGIRFKRGWIDSQAVELGEVEQANSLLTGLVAAACYGTPGVDIPAPPPLGGPSNPAPLVRWWILPSAWVLVLIAGLVLRQYGSGVMVTVVTKPAGVAVLLDGAFQGSSDRSSGIMVIPRVTREMHSIGAEAYGYEKYSQDLAVGGLESAHRAEVSLSPLKYAVTFVITPSGARLQIDGKDAGTTDESGRLTVSDLERGSHSLSITHDGYKSESVSLEVQGRREWRTALVSEADAARQEAEQRERGTTEHIDRARTYFHQGQYKEALSECESALQVEPANSAVLALKKQIEQTRSILGQ